MIAFVFLFTIVVTAFVLLMMTAQGNAVDRKLDDTFEGIQEFKVSISYKSSIYKNAIAIDIDRAKNAVLLNPLKIMSLESKPLVYSFDDLLAVELTRDDATVVKTNLGSQATGAAIGGVLLGPAGILLGGLSASKREESKVKKLSLKLHTNDLIRPVQEILFWDGGSHGVDPQQINFVFSDLDQWYGRLRAIIERGNQAA